MHGQQNIRTSKYKGCVE